MITDLFIQLVYWFVNGLINLFPVGTGFPPIVASSASLIGGYASTFSPLIDFPQLAAAVALLFVVELGVFGFKTLKWVLSHLPFIGGAG